MKQKMKCKLLGHIPVEKAYLEYKANSKSTVTYKTRCKRCKKKLNEIKELW